MANETLKPCRLCFKLISGTDFEAIEEIRMEMLKVLLIDMNLDINDRPVMCNSCLGKLQNCFNFKSTCFYVEDYITPFVKQGTKIDIEQLFRKEMKQVNKGTNFTCNKICRLCMTPTENGYYKDMNEEGNTWLAEILRKCLPELDFTLTYDPIVCENCVQNLEACSILIKICSEVEKIISCYQERNGNNVGDKVDLFDVLRFAREIYNPLKLCITLENNILLPTTSPQHTRLKAEFSCDKCSFKTDHSTAFKAHLLRRHHSTPIFMCDICNYKSESRLKLTSHLVKHRGPTKQFGCTECEYETDIKSCYRQHLLRHLNPTERPTYKSELCLFKTETKTTISVHKKLYHNENVKLHKCTKCNFETKHNNSLKYHMLAHEDPKDVPMYECSHCNFKAKNKGNLSQHVLIHGDPDEVMKFKCEKCSYRGKSRKSLKQHSMRHMEVDEVKIYRCGVCSYISNFRVNFIRHQKTHQSVSERKLFQCHLCDYKAKTKISVTHHLLSHKDPSEITMYQCDECSYKTKIKSKLPAHKKKKHLRKEEVCTFKCMHCIFETNNKNSLRNHIVIHMDIEKLEMFKCEQCDFTSKHKNSLKSHMTFIHNSEDLPYFKCPHCDYKTHAKSNLNGHRLTHLEMGTTTTMYKCDKCKFATKYKYNLKDHTRVCKKKK